MNAGSSRVIGKTPIKRFIVASSQAPVVEIDTEASATYVRFGRGKVTRTEPFQGTESLVMVDFDRQNRVLGIEFIGRKEFGIVSLLHGFPVQVDDRVLTRTRYISADLATKTN
jgi:uncharacterized protein YuzE